IFAAFQVLLFRLTGQTDIRVGSPMSSRTQPEFRDVVGYLANPIVVRGDLAENPTFKAFLKQLGQSVLGALDHIEYPFPLLVEQLQPERDPSRSPLYQVGLAWDKARLPSATPQDATSGQGLEIILWEQRGAQVDLVLTVYEQGPSLAISWRYCTDLFEPE